jgi:hypothetical protein
MAAVTVRSPGRFELMPKAALFTLDLIAIAVLTFAIYFPRHRRRDLVVAYLGLNVGVLAVTAALTSADVGAGVGFGLFGVLSIIRLRSTQVDQQEVAYYFASLGLGLIGGVAITPGWLNPALMVAVLAAFYVGDHPRLCRRYRVQELVVDAAYTDEAALTRRLESLLGARVHRVLVRKVDLVNGTTAVEARYEVPLARHRPDRIPPATMASDDRVVQTPR